MISGVKWGRDDTVREVEKEKESGKRKERSLRRRREQLEDEEEGPRKKEEKEGAEEHRRRKEEEGRMNSIVISGVKWGRDDTVREVEKWIEGAMKIRVKVRKAREISFRNGGQGMVAEMGTWEEKRREMGRKKEFKEGV